MKLLKGIASVSALSLALLGSPFSTASAVELQESEEQQVQKQEPKLKEYKKMSKEERKEKLKKLKYDKKKVTEEQINSISDELLASLDPNGEIVGITEEASNLNTPNEGEIQMRLMPTSDFKMKTVVQRIAAQPGYENFQFTAEGQWYINPAYEFVDTIALAWSDDFTLYHDESLHYTTKDGRNYYFEGTRNDADGEKGVGHNIDLKVGYSDNKSIILAKVYEKNRTGTANVVGEYGHVEVTPSSLVLAFTGGGETKPAVGFEGFGAAKVNEASPAYSAFNY